MPGTVSHILSATTPDNPAYEIRPSHWNSSHAFSFVAAGSEIIGAFSNENNVSFSTNGAGRVVASASLSAVPSSLNVTGANGSSVSAQTLAFSNANGISLGVSTAANGATVTGSYTVPNAYVSSVNGSSGAISLNAGSSLSSSTNGSSITFGLASDITTALQPAGAYLTTAAQSNHSHGFSAAGGSSAFQTLSFSNGGGVSFTNTNGQVGASVATTYAGSNHSHGNPTLNLTNLSGTTASNSAGFTLSLSANAPTSNFSAGVSGGNTSGDTGATGTRVVFAGGNNITLSQATNANGATITVSGANIGGAQTGISGIQVSDTTYTSGTVTLRNANGISFGSSGAGGISASYTVPTITNSSWTVSDAASSATVARLAFTNQNGVTLSLSTGAGGSHTIVGSHNALTSQSNQNVTAANGGFAFQTLSFSNANAFSFGTSAGSAITGSYTVPSVTQYFSATNTTFNGTNVSGSLTLNTAGLRVDLSGNAAFSAGVSGGNTSGDTGATGTRVVFAGGNNITLSQATNANGATITVSGANIGGAQTGISGIQVSDTTYTSGTVTFRNANGISFGSSGAGGISASYTVPTVTNSSWTVSDNATSGTVARLAFTNQNGITLSLSTGAGGSHTIVGSHNALTSQSNQNITAANGGFAFQTLSFSNTNGVSFITSAGSAIAASVVTSYRASNDAIGLNTAQSNVTWTVNSSGISFDARGYAGTGTSATNASVTLNSNGLAISVAGAADGVNIIAAGTRTATTNGTVLLSNANGISFGLDQVNGSIVTASYTVPTVPTSYVSNVNGSSGAISFATGSSLSSSSNGSTITWGLASNITTALQSAGAYLTTAALSNHSHGVTAANGGFNFQTLSFSNANGVSFATSAGSALVGSVATTYRASNDAIGLNTAQTNVTWTVNSSGLSLNAGGYAGTATGFTGANISGSMTHNTAGLSLSLSANAPGAATLTVSAVGNTTVNSSGTWPNAISARAYGVLSIGTSNGSLLFSTPDPVDFTQLSVGNSNVGNTAGDTGVFTGRLVLVGSNNITLSGSSNGGSQTISIIGGAGGGGAANFNLLGANTSGNTTATGSTIGLSGLNVTLSGTNNSVIVVSAPATSSIVGTSGVSISTNGSTISVFPQPLSDWANAFEITQAGTAQGNSLVSILPLRLDWPVVASNVLVAGSVAVGSAANNSSAYFDMTLSGVLYTRNASTLSSLFSFSNSYTQSFSSNATVTAGGAIAFTATFAGSTLTPGNYWMAVHVSTNNTATGGANTTALPNTVSMILARQIGSAAQGIKFFNGATANSLGFVSGQGIISTGATRASIAFSDYTVTGTRGVLAGVAVVLRNQTYQ